MAKKIQWKKSKIDYSKLSELTHQKMVATEIIEMVNKDPLHKEWASQGGKIQGKINAESGHIKEIQKLSPKKFTQNAIDIAAKVNKVRMSSKESRDIQVAGGKVGGKVSQQIERTCPHCNKTIKGSLYFRWHGDKCKNLTIK